MFKKSLSFIVAIMMIFSCMSLMSFAANEKTTVSLRIEGIDECIYYSDVTVSGKATVSDVIRTADEGDDKLSVVIDETKYGDYITTVNGIAAGSYTLMKWDGWCYRVDGVEADVSVDGYTVSGGEEIVLYYADPWNTGMQYPIINTSKLSDGIISFTSIDAVYEGFNKVETECPVKDYTLTWGIGNKTVEITPDENGVCKIPYKYLTFGNHTIQIERYDENNGLPTVLRFAPDYSVRIGAVDALTAFFRMLIEVITSFFGA